MLCRNVTLTSDSDFNALLKWGFTLLSKLRLSLRMASLMTESINESKVGYGTTPGKGHQLEAEESCSQDKGACFALSIRDERLD
jgi:hypothetical protein